jgi:diguanylate cyclase (GGDEF)-like protein
MNSIQIFRNLDKYEANNYIKKQNDLNIIVGDMHKVSNALFDNVINTNKVIDVFKKAYKSNDKEKLKIRNELYHLLINNYENFTKYGVQQLHFHLPNNDSFLRFHKPSKFGDNLSNVRASVKFVNENKISIIGFEEGRIFNGYRFVYPLFDENNTHIGSVEISSSLLNFKTIFEKNNKAHLDYILKKDVVEKKVFNDQLNNYEKYFLSDDFLIQSTLAEYDVNCQHKEEKNFALSRLIKDKEFLHKIKNLEAFYDIYLHNFKVYSIDFIPLVNDFTSEKVGYIVIFAESDYFKYILDSYIIILLILIVLSILVGYLLYKNEQTKTFVKKQSFEYKSILNLYENMVIIVDKYKIINANNKFLAFYNLTSLNQNLEILKIDNIFTYSKDMNCQKNTDIFDKLMDFNLIDNEISMKNDKGQKRYFNVYVHKLELDLKTNYILELIDITDHKNETFKLKEKALYDKLTKVYNRHYFEQKLEEEFATIHLKNNSLSLIMFDIDHFKLINDEYGHVIGDESLIFISELITKNIRKTDIFSRWGGEEFMILSEKSLEDTITMAEYLRKLIEEETKRHNTLPAFTCSFGVITLHSISSLKEGLQKVDELLYKSKNEGRNKVTY